VAGRAAVSFGAGARLKDLAQAGSAKAMMPRMHGRAPEVVFLNTAGGLTGGDRLDYAVDLAGACRRHDPDGGARLSQHGRRSPRSRRG
jgi:urease accessory protein